MWAPETFFMQEIDWRYHLYQGRDKLWCTQKKKKGPKIGIPKWILGSCGVHYRSISGAHNW
jgi:hypothetical protein